MSSTIYLDNAATTWPKPDEVRIAMDDFLRNGGGNPGRSGHRWSVANARTVFETRELLASFFNVPSSDQVIFTMNATHALNMAIHGSLKKGDHVIISGMEHNSVIRPLRFLEEKVGVSLDTIPVGENGTFNLLAYERLFRPETRMVICIHASNVDGRTMPIEDIGKISRNHGALFMVDAAQSAGYLDIDMRKACIDLLALTGHKKLYGPTGTGALCLGSEFIPEALMQGGTGSHSENQIQPKFLPDALEAGTINISGITGLNAALLFLSQMGLPAIRAKVDVLLEEFLDAMKQIDRVRVFASREKESRAPLCSLNIEGMSSSDLAWRLDHEFGILTRAGLHCAPMAHQSLGSFPEGSVRFSFGLFNTLRDVERTIDAIKNIVGE